ncbi:MAG: tetratricopeptide repeat protein, partial [Bdellovibrionota bacterium]
VESENVGKFCQEPLNENKDVFLPFYPVHEKVNFGRWFAVTTADTEFPYYEPTSKEKDAQHVRLALKLYREGNPALVIKILDFMEKEKSDSSFRLEMKFLRANALIKLGYTVEANEILNKIISETKETPVALHAAMYIATKRYNEGAFLPALEQFMWLAANHPTHRLAWVFHFGAAECLYELKQMERAAKEYQWVAENAKDPKDQAETVLRMGDLTLQRFHYAQALGAYSTGIKHFEKESANYPSVYINRAEALYGLAEFDRAKVAFESFLSKFPSHPAGWRATYRLAEIYGRKGPDATNEEARKWFYETINRYPFSPGATMARLRLLPCGDHGGFDLIALDRFFSGEALRFDGRNELSSAKYQDMKAISHVRSLISSGQEGRAVEVAISEIKAQRSPQTREILGNLLARLFRKHVLTLLTEGNKFEALAFYQDKLVWIPKEAAEVDHDYLLKLSQAASDLNLGKLAQQIADRYTKTQATPQNRGIASSVDSIGFDPLRSSELNFTQAKALWITQGPEAEIKIRELLSEVKDESPFSYGKEILLSVLDHRAGNLAQALSHGLRAQLLMPTGSQNIDDHLRLGFWIADLELRSGSFEMAYQMYREVEKLSDLNPKSGPEGLTAL